MKREAVLLYLEKASKKEKGGEMEKKEQVRSRVALVLLGLLFCYFFVVFSFAIVYSIKHSPNSHTYLSPLVMVLFILGGIGLSWGAGKLLQKRKMSLSFFWKTTLLILVSLVPRLILVVFFQGEQVSDYRYYYDMAVRFAKENPFVPGSYMTAIASNTLSYVSFLGTLFRLFGESILLGLVINVFFTTGSVVLVYLCGRKLMPEKYAFAAGLLYALSPTTFFYSLSLATEPLALATFLLGLYGFLKSREEKKQKNSWVLAFWGE